MTSNETGVTEKSSSEIYWEYAREVADSPKAYMHNEALMELGRTVCKTKSPLCETCPLRGECRAFLDGRTAEFPPTKKRTEKSWHGTVLVIESADEKILAVNGGQKFLDKQLALPHFESARHATVALPAKAEDYINADEVESVEHCGTFRHSITVHKIECDILHVRLATRAKATHLPKSIVNSEKPTAFEWIEKAKAFETFANSFSLKALKKIFCFKKNILGDACILRLCSGQAPAGMTVGTRRLSLQCRRIECGYIRHLEFQSLLYPKPELLSQPKKFHTSGNAVQMLHPRTNRPLQ